jgi:two-component system sensor histidine kinase/response regulator
VSSLRPAHIILVLLLAVPFRSHAADDPAIAAAGIKRIDSLNNLAFQQKRFDVALALNNLFIAENLAINLGYQHGLAITYLYEGGIFHQNGYDKRALSTYYKALQIFKSSKDTFYTAQTSQQIAISLQSDGKIDEALQLYNQALQVYTGLNKKQEIANINNSLGALYIELKQNEKADTYLKTALQISLSDGYRYGEKKAYYNLGLLEYAKGNYAIASDYHNRSMSIDSVMKDRYGTSLNLLALSNIARRQNNTARAQALSQLAYRTASQIMAYNLLKDAALQLVDLNRRSGDEKRASAWQDSVLKTYRGQFENEKEYAQNFIDVIKNQDVKNTTAEKEVERQRKLQKEQLLIITVGTFILIVVAVLAVLALVNYQRQRFFGKELKQKNEIIEKNSASLDQLNKEISHQNALLEEDNKTKNKLLSIISHDLRTPLVNTKGVLNLVNQGMVPAEEADRLLQLLETQYLGTTSLLDNLLFWIKGQMEGGEVEKVKVGLYQLIRSLEEEQRIPITKKKIQFHNHIDRNLTILTEKEMIRIVCRNLISNAIKFMNENGVIELNAKVDDQQFLCISVKDNGIGMTKEAIEKVNAKQYYNTTGTSYEKGSGFGLMLCRDLIAKTGGELLIESEPGKGSTFTVRMPYIPA